MKRIMLTSALVLGVAAPAFAASDSSNARAQAIHNALAAEAGTGVESRIFRGGSDVHTDRAIEIHTELAAETDTGIESNINLSTDAASVSTRGAVNARAQAIFDALLEAEDAADK